MTITTKKSAATNYLEENSGSAYNVFRIVFVIWACFWSVVNLLNLLSQYVAFENMYNSSDEARLAIWLIRTVSLATTVALGVVMIIKMVTIASDIENRKAIKNLTLFTVLMVFYYFFANIMRIVATVVFDAGNFYRESIFTIAWLMPSLIFFVFHLMYFNHLSGYNAALDEKETKIEVKE